MKAARLSGNNASAAADWAALSMATSARSASIPPFSPFCPGAAAGSAEALQIDVHSEERWYASGLEAGDATYANRVEKERGGIWLWMTGHLRWLHDKEWSLKSTGRAFACHEIGFVPLEKGTNPF